VGPGGSVILISGAILAMEHRALSRLMFDHLACELSAYIEGTIGFEEALDFLR
jgi:hypothetical protein